MLDRLEVYCEVKKMVFRELRPDEETIRGFNSNMDIIYNFSPRGDVNISIEKLIGALYKKFHVEVPISEENKVNTVKGIADYICNVKSKKRKKKK
jgi:hypothetical protein